MQLLAHIRTLFDYDFWATGIMLECMRACEAPAPEARRQLAHYLSARRAWLTRLKLGQSFEVELWPEISADEAGLLALEELSGSTAADLRELLAAITEEQLFATVHYQSYERNAEQRRLLDILTQLVNHASYHRGFVIAALKAGGAEVRGSDYIEYSRRLA